MSETRNLLCPDDALLREPSQQLQYERSLVGVLSPPSLSVTRIKDRPESGVIRTLSVC